MMLDLGCGELNEGDVGIDIRCVEGVTVVCDAHCLPFRDGAFDYVKAYSALEHMCNPFRVCREIHRVLEPSGSAVMLVPNDALLYDYRLKLILAGKWHFAREVSKSLGRGEHKWKFTRKNLENMLHKAGFPKTEVWNSRWHRLPRTGDIRAMARKGDHGK